MRKRHSNGQLKPLALSPAAQERRTIKNEYRQHISREHAITRGMAVGCLTVLRRGFWGRLKWLLMGR